jgi:hypothetical protein
MVDSSKTSAAQFGFGSSTRDHAQKVFLSAEQAKVNFGLNSPGPAAGAYTRPHLCST